MGDCNFRREVTIVNDHGLHVRPASLFVSQASKFSSEVILTRGETRADGKSVLQLISLVAPLGATVVIETRGADAAQAIETLSELIASGFRESESVR